MLPSTCGKTKNLQSPQARREPWTIGRTTRAKPVSWISECLITGRTCQSVMSFSEPIPCGCIFKQCYFRNGRIRTVFHRKNLFTLDCLKQPHLSHFRKRRPWPPLTPTTVVDCWNKCLTTSFRMLTTFSSKWKLENFTTLFTNVVNNNLIIVVNGWGSSCKHGRIEKPRSNSQSHYRTP